MRDIKITINDLINIILFKIVSVLNFIAVENEEPKKDYEQLEEWMYY